MEVSKYPICDKCQRMDSTVKGIRVEADEKTIRLCSTCQVNLLQWMFDWTYTGDCVETCQSLKEFMSAGPRDEDR